MKYSSLAAFAKHVESAAPNHLSSIYTILSKEEFVRKQAVDFFTKSVLQKDAASPFSLAILDAEKHSINAILEELSSLSFFAKKRVVVVHNVDILNKESTTKLERYFESPNPSLYLVLTASTLNRATTFYKKAEKIGIVMDVPEEKPWEKEKNVTEWLRSEAKKNGKEMSPQVCQLIVKQLGTEQTTLHNELQKLICYVGEKKTIEERDVAAISISMNLENAWQLGEAIFQRDAAKALRISKSLVADGTALIALLRQVRSQFQTEYQICSILTGGGSPDEITKQFPYMKGSILDRHMRQAQQYGMGRFKQGLLAIDDTELQAKSSSADPDFLIERLMIKLTTG